MFEYSINTFGSLQYFILTSSRFLIKKSYLGSLKSFAYKQILSISTSCIIKLGNAFVFSYPEPPVIKIVYRWSGINGNLLLCSSLFSLVILSRWIILQCMIMTALNKVKSHTDVVDYFTELPIYNKHIEKPKIKCLKNIDLLSELPFYEKLNIIKNRSCV